MIIPGLQSVFVDNRHGSFIYEYPTRLTKDTVRCRTAGNEYVTVLRGIRLSPAERPAKFPIGLMT